MVSICYSLAMSSRSVSRIFNLCHLQSDFEASPVALRVSSIGSLIIIFIRNPKRPEAMRAGRHQRAGGSRSFAVSPQEKY